MRRVVWQVDPVHLTPYYDAALCDALAQSGWNVRQFTAPFLYDTAFTPAQNYAVDYSYGWGLNRRWWLTYPRLRRLMRRLLYSAGHRQLIRLIDAHRPDVVHIQWSRLPKLDLWLVEQIQARGIPVVHTVHDTEPLFAHVDTHHLVAVYSQADRLIVHANANRDSLLQHYPQLEYDRVSLIPHPMIRFSMPEWANRARARHELGIPSEVPVVLFFGTVRPYKGLDILIDAYERALLERPDLWLLIAGLQDKARSHRNLGSQVIVHDTYVPSDRVWIYHRAADVAVFPYRRISQSGALITAMSFGMPVIAVDIGGLPETVDGNGWIVPAGSRDSLANALVDMLRDEARLRCMASQSLQLIRERHAPKVIAGLTMAVYEEVIGAAHPVLHR